MGGNKGLGPCLHCVRSGDGWGFERLCELESTPAPSAESGSSCVDQPAAAVEELSDLISERKQRYVFLQKISNF